MQSLLRTFLTFFLLWLWIGAMAQNDRTTPGGKADDNFDLIGSGTDRGPSPDAFERRAIRCQKGGDYYAAMRYFAEVIRLDSVRRSAYWGYGDCALEIYNLKEADVTYDRLANWTPGASDSKALLKRGETRMRMADYPTALQLFEKALEDTGSLSSDEVKEAKAGVKRAKWAINNTSPQRTLTIDTLSGYINHDTFADYAGRIIGDTLYFASYSFPYKRWLLDQERRLSKMVMVSSPFGQKAFAANSNQDTTVRITLTPFNEDNKHATNIAFSRDGNKVYYTLCEFVDQALIRCDLYVKERQGMAWGAARKLPEPINGKDFTTTQPAVGWNGEEEVLFFVSDRPGSRGRDLYFTRMQADSFSAPVRLDQLNTERDESTPYYDAAHQRLYFSSNGREGFGGFDIYQVDGFGTEWGQPQNVGSAINTRFNDINFTLDKKGYTAYFSSSPGEADNIGTDTEKSCCYDMYRTCLIDPVLVVKVFDLDTGLPVDDAEVSITDLDTGAEIAPAQVEGNLYYLPIEAGKRYEYRAWKPYCPAVTGSLETPSYLCDILDREVRLDPAKVSLITQVLEFGTNAPLFDTKRVFTDKGNVLTRGVVQTKEDGRTDSNRYDDTLTFRHEYEMTFSKVGYSPAFDTVSTDFYTERDTVIQKQVFMRKGIKLIVCTYEEGESTPLDSVGYTFRQFDEEGNVVAEEFEFVPDSCYKRIIDFNGLYEVTACKKDFFIGATGEFRSPKATFQADTTLFRQILIRPSFVPEKPNISLYFDNDRPGQKVLNNQRIPEKASENFVKIYSAYERSKDLFYVPKVQKHFKNEGAAAAFVDSVLASIETFFLDSINGEYLRYRDLVTGPLTEHLERGAKVTITLRGFASPRAKGKIIKDGKTYNDLLTERRIDCIEQLIKDQAKATGNLNNLVFVHKPNGDSLSAPGVKQDGVLSIYSPEAMKERKVVIEGIKIENRVGECSQ